MKYMALTLLTAGAIASAPTVNGQASERVEHLLSDMTLEEKVGQMTQLTLTAVAARPSQGSGRVELDPDLLREALVDRHIGSLLNAHDEALPLEGWHELITEIQDVATNETRLGIPIVYGIDAIHGTGYMMDATIFPHNLGLAATFNPELVRRTGEITAVEVLASGITWNFGPVLDMGRHPAWPRFYETFGEDPYLASILGRAAFEGQQSVETFGASMKHYLGYGQPYSGRDRAPTYLPEYLVREIHLAPFAEAMHADPAAVMVNSGEINGVPVHASYYWLTEVLRGELGFEGVIVTDWMDVIFLHTRHRIARDLREATRLAVEAGIDMSMTPYDFAFADHLISLVQDGVIPESRIDESVRRILTMKERMGLFDDPYPDQSLSDDFALPESRAVARQAAAESITLLQNDGILPLQEGGRILVTGPAARSLSALNGGWTHTWQGVDEQFFPDDYVTLLDELHERNVTVAYEEGAGFLEKGNIEAAVDLARHADVAIVVLGEQGYSEWVGDISDLALPEPQIQLAEAIIATGTPTVVVLLQGRPRLISRFADDAAAIVMAYWPGMEGAQAIADVLFGDVNPSGRLPFTYPRAANELIPYDHRFVETLNTGFDRQAGGFNPQYEFGHGLSYTTFEYSDLEVHRTMARTNRYRIEIQVTNTGDRAGREHVLLYVRQNVASLTPPVKRLRGFQSVNLEPGESARVTFELDDPDFSYIGLEGMPVLEPGVFDILIGDFTESLNVLNYFQ